MGLDAMWQQCAYAGNQVLAWLRNEAGIHPLIFLGIVVVIVAAVILYKTEVRGR
jgi:hypothetical protein